MNGWIRNLGDSLMQAPLAMRASAYYQSLAPRDRQALKVLAGFLLPILIVFGVMVPAYGFMHDNLSHYQRALDDLRWIEANKGAVVHLAEGERQPGQSLFGLANSTSKGFQIGFKRYEPIGDNGLNLWMENVSFNSLILWLERLDKRHGVSVREISVERLPAEGLVNVRLVLQG